MTQAAAITREYPNVVVNPGLLSLTCVDFARRDRLQIEFANGRKETVRNMARWQIFLQENIGVVATMATVIKGKTKN